MSITLEPQPVYRNRLEHCADSVRTAGSAFGKWSVEVITPIRISLKSFVDKTANFISNNWKRLIAYLFAWGVILLCTGLMYGFNAVALPLTIGLSCGLGGGIVSGILMVELLKIYDPDDKLRGKNTLWDLLNRGLESLDPNGTRQIVLSVAVTVLLAAAVVFPYVIGAGIGVFIGNQLATKAGQDKNLGRDPQNIQTVHDELLEEICILKQMQGQIHITVADLQKKVEQLQDKESLFQELKKIQDLEENIQNKINEMQTNLETFSETQN